MKSELIDQFISPRVQQMLSPTGSPKESDSQSIKFLQEEPPSERESARSQGSFVREQEDAPQKRLIGFLVAGVYPICQSIYQTGAKFLQLEGMSLIEISAMRFIVALFITGGVMKLNGKHLFSDFTCKKDFYFVLIRNLASTTFFNLMVLTTSFIPLSIMILIINTSGFWASIIGYYAFGDKLKLVDVVGMILAYVAIVLIIIGGMESDQDEVEKQRFQLGMACSITLSLLCAAEMVLTRKIKHIHYSVVNMHYSILGLAVVILPLFYTFTSQDWKIFDYGFGMNMLLIMASMAVAVGKLSFILANQLEKAALVSVVFQLAIFYNFLADILIFDYSFTLWQVIGGLLLLGVIFALGLIKALNLFS